MGSSAGTAPRTRGGRWLLWLTAGVLAGLVIGFAYGLTKPRTRG